MSARSWFTTSSFAAIALFAATARAQESQPPAASEAPVTPASARPAIATLYPADTQILVAIDDLPDFFAGWAASPWGRLIADEKMAAVKGALTNFVDTVGAETEKEIGVNLIETLRLFSGRIGYGFGGRVNTSDLAQSSGFSQLAIDAHEHAADLDQRFTKMLEKTHALGEKSVVKHEADGDVAITVVSRAEDDNRGETMRFAACANTFLFGANFGKTDRNDFGAAVGALRGEGRASMADLRDYADSLAARPGGLKLWIDWKWFLIGRNVRAAADELAAEGKRAEEKSEDEILGLQEMQAVAARFDVGEEGMRLDAKLAWSGKGGIARVAQAWLGGGDASLMKLVPAAATTVVNLNLGLKTGVDATEALMKELGLPPLFSELAVDAAEPADGDAKTPPIDTKKDIIDHLDGRVAAFLAPVDETEALRLIPTATPTNVAFILGVKDGAALRAAIDKLVRSQGLHAVRKKTEFQGFEVYTLPTQPFSVIYAILDDVAVVSFAPTLIQDVLRRKGDQELPSIASDADFKRQLAGMTHDCPLLFFSRLSADFATSLGAVVDRASSLAGPVLGEPHERGKKPDDAPASPLAQRLDELRAALSGLDPGVVKKHLPPGSLLGLAVDATGVALEGVSR